MPRIAIIDGGELAYKAALGGTLRVDWDGNGEKTTTDVTEEQALAAVRNILAEWTRPIRPDGIRIAMSDGTCFRNILEPTYKSNRGERPTHHAALIRYLKSEHKCMSEVGLEADDILGINCTSDKAEIWIVSSDKDMLTLPNARLYRPHKKTKHRIRPVEADFNWLYQTLCGDPTDGYKGCPKIGAVNATKILERAGFDFWDRWAAVANAFHLAGIPSHAVLQARLSRILRPGDLKDGRIHLWSPGPLKHWMEQSECNARATTATTTPDSATPSSPLPVTSAPTPAAPKRSPASPPSGPSTEPAPIPGVRQKKPRVKVVQ